MSKSLYIAEKPSVAVEFAKALGINARKSDGYIESEGAIITWCVGHLVTMSYPDKYDAKMKWWNLSTLPFLPKEYKYEIIPNVSKQFNIVKGLLNRKDVDVIYVCTDSGREGEYIYRLVDMMAGVTGKEKKRVWIDSQTEEEILRGIQQAKDLSEYDSLSAAAYLRAKEDYLMGINFTRLLTLKYGDSIKKYLKTDKAVLAVGRVMTCVLGMVVRREREIRAFVKTPFFRVIALTNVRDNTFEAEWKAVEGSSYFQSPYLYKENGFKEREKANELILNLSDKTPITGNIETIEKKKENKNPPLLFNLAELQNESSKLFKISPDETLKIVQELYEKKLITYPRTDARVLSKAVSKEIYKNLNGLKNYSLCASNAAEVLESKTYEKLESSRYVNDKQITDHYAIIPTGQGLNAQASLSPNSSKVYETIVRRFLSIFYPPAVYQKIGICIKIKDERFFANFKILVEEGYLKVVTNSFDKKKQEYTDEKNDDLKDATGDRYGKEFFEEMKKLKVGMEVGIDKLFIKEGETSPPKKYNSGSIILAMENAGQLIEDEELRAQIKGSGIGTSATRAEILKKLITIEYLALNKKTQIISPTQLGEMIFDVVSQSIQALLNPELTASWEKGLTYVSEGSISPEEYMEKLEKFIILRTQKVLGLNNQYFLTDNFNQIASYYKS